jgi:hypothetical protein
MGAKSFLSIIIIVIIIGWGYFYFEKFLTEKEIQITVINSEKYGDIPGKYFIFTDHEVFLDENNSRQDKYNADELFRKLKKGGTYKVKVVGQHIPYISEFRNITKIVDNNKPEKTTRYP